MIDQLEKSTVTLLSIIFILIWSSVEVGCDQRSSQDQSDQGVGDESQEISSECPPHTSGGDDQRGGDEVRGGTQAGTQTAGAEAGGTQGGGMQVGGTQTGGAQTGGAQTGGAQSAGDETAGVEAGFQVAGTEGEGGSEGGTELIDLTEASSRYDGVYIAAFSSEGSKSALAKVRIIEGLITGEAISRFDERFTVGGFVDARGVLRIPPVLGSMLNTVHMVGRVNTVGLIEGSYTIGDQEGTFAGSLDNQSLSTPSLEYDALYDLNFIQNDQEVGATVMEIRGGRFEVVIVNHEGDRFVGRGFVCEDGTLVLDNGIDDQFSLIAEGEIDVDHRTIKGIYSVGSRVGEIRGQLSD